MLVALTLAACGDDDDEEDTSAPPTATRTATRDGSPIIGFMSADRSPFGSGRIFSDSSPFNTPIGPAPAIHPDSDRFVATLAERAADGDGIVIATGEWTVQAYLADTDTPRYDVRLTVDWSPFERIVGVPIPDAATPDPEDDGHLTVIDLDGDLVYDLWQARKRNGRWEASWGNRIALDSDSIYPEGMSARGSGFSSLLGLVWPHELSQGRIEHALIFSHIPNRASVYVWPGTESDGRSDDPLTIPEGVRLQLDPGLDLDTLGLAPWERTIVRAMQAYGLILADNGSASIGLELVHPQSFGGIPVPYETFDGVGVLDHIPVDRLRLFDYDELPLDESTLRVTDESAYAGPREVE